MATARTEVQRRKHALAQHKRAEDNLKIEAQRLEDEADDLQDKLDKGRVQDGHLDALKDNLKEAESEKTMHSNSLEDSAAALQSVKDKIKDLKRQIAIRNNELQPLENDVRIAENECSKAEDHRRAVLAQKNAAYERVNDLNLERNARLSDKEAIVRTVESYSEQASIVSSRVPVDAGETPDSLDKKLEKLHRDLDRFDKE